MQTITKDGKIICQTKTDYPPETVKELKKAGYKVRIDNERESELPRKP